MQVGDYVRTKYYGISKILNISNETTTNYCSLKLDKIDDFGRLGVYISKENIIKSNPNIIDLIEAGDYVNGLKVSRVGGTYHGRKDKAIYCDYCVDKEAGKWTMIYDDEIKSIVTKEQFEAMEYKVGVDKE